MLDLSNKQAKPKNFDTSKYFRRTIQTIIINIKIPNKRIIYKNSLLKSHEFQNLEYLTQFYTSLKFFPSFQVFTLLLHKY